MRALYDLRKSSLLWLRELFSTLVALDLQQILEESCLFIDHQEIILFFYVDDIVFIFVSNRSLDVEILVQKLKLRFELRDMSQLKFFLDVRVIQNDENIYLCQNSYVDKLIIEYEIDTTKSSFSSMSFDFIVTSIYSFETHLEVDSVLKQEYRKKVESICYSANITRSDIVKTTSKLIEHFTNSDSKHLRAANHCLQYLSDTKYLAIRYSISRNDELTAQISDQSHHVFENTVDASFVNSFERRSYEDYTFKLYEDMIDWAARKQTTVSTSTTKIELLALLHADKTCIWWINLFVTSYHQQAPTSRRDLPLMSTRAERWIPIYQGKLS